MLIQRVNRTTAEKVFLICQNGTGATINLGMGTRYLGGVVAENASTDGVQIAALEAGATGVAAMCQFAGIADQDIASLGYGRIQAWGYVNSIMLSNQGTSVTIGNESARASTFLQPGAVAGTWHSAFACTPQTAYSTAPFGTMSKYVQVMPKPSVIGSLGYPLSFGVSAYCSGFVRAL